MPAAEQQLGAAQAAQCGLDGGGERQDGLPAQLQPNYALTRAGKATGSRAWQSKAARGSGGGAPAQGPVESGGA